MVKNKITKKLIILLTVDPEIPVPPIGYGGIERIVDSLVMQFTIEGHVVYLLANKDSTSKYAKQIFGWRGKDSSLRNTLTNALQLKKIVKLVKPNVVHSFSRLLYLYPLFFNSSLKIIQSYQREISTKSTGLATFLSKGKLVFTACAAHLFTHFKSKHNWHAIYNFTDTEYFKPDVQKERNYYAFLGRIEPIKGTYEAIQACISANVKLLIAGNIPKEYEWYFDEKVKPYLKEGIIEYIGVVNDAQKLDLLQGAKAMLFPILWEEPFGIVMAESLACGSPVIAFKRGSVPEVIEDGVNGFVVDDIYGIAKSIEIMSSINNETTRRSATNKFSLKLISQKYLMLYQKK